MIKRFEPRTITTETTTTERDQIMPEANANTVNISFRHVLVLFEKSVYLKKKNADDFGII